MAITCRKCLLCINVGRQNTQQNRLGRKRYYCTHNRAAELSRAMSNYAVCFIGFGDMQTSESALKLKTTPKWCPYKQDCKGSGLEKEAQKSTT